MSPEGGTFLYGPEKKEKLFSFRWREPFTIGEQGFTLYSKYLVKCKNSLHCQIPYCC